MFVDCQNQPNKAAQAGKLVDILEGRDGKLFPAFIEALCDEAVNLQHVVEELWPDYKKPGSDNGKLDTGLPHSLHRPDTLCEYTSAYKRLNGQAVGSGSLPVLVFGVALTE